MKDYQLELLRLINNKETTASFYEVTIFIEKFSKKEAIELINKVNNGVSIVYPVMEALSLFLNEDKIREVRKITFNKDIIENNKI